MRTCWIILLVGIMALMACQEEQTETSETEAAPLDDILERYYTPDDGQVLVAAHRGHWTNYPENSLPAIQSIIDHGGDIVEIDVRITRDNHLVLMHDKTLDRTTNGTGEVLTKSLSQLKELFLKDNDGNITEDTIPTLEEALLLAKDNVMIMIDKAEYLIPEAMEVVEATGTADQVIFMGFDTWDEVTTDFGDALDSIVYIPALSKDTESPLSYITTFQQNMDVSAFAFWFKSDDADVLTYIPTASASSRIWINTTSSSQSGSHTDAVSLTDPDEGWGWVIDAGANIILTDYPVSLLQYLQQNDRHP